MIVYIDTSTFLRAFLPDEEGHSHAKALIESPPSDVVVVTGWMTRIEAVASITKRARHLDQQERDRIVDALDAELGADGSVIEILPDPDQYEEIRHTSYRIAREHWVKGPDAIHIACALAIRAMLPELMADDETTADLRFVTSDEEQRAAAIEEGLLDLDVELPQDHDDVDSGRADDRAASHPWDELEW